MAFGQSVLTNAGRALAASVMADELALNIHEIWLGDGQIIDRNNATDLTNKRIKCEILAKEQQGNDCIIRFRITNETLTSGNVLMREIGFFAKDKQGHSVLFSTIVDDTPFTLPDVTNHGVYRQTMAVAFGYSNAEQVTVAPTIKEGLDEDEVDVLIGRHNTSMYAHSDLLSQYIRKDGDTATGKIYVPTPETSDNSRVIANTAFVNNIVDELIKRILGDAPSNMRTMEALAQALANDPTFADTMRAELAKRAPLNSPTFSGSVRVPTAGGGENSTIAASTQWVNNFVSGKNYIPSGQTRSSYNQNGFRVFSDGFCIQWVMFDIPNKQQYYDVSLPIKCRVLGAVPTDVAYGVTTNGTDSKIGWCVEASKGGKIRVITNDLYISSCNMLVAGLI